MKCDSQKKLRLRYLYECLSVTDSFWKPTVNYNLNFLDQYNNNNSTIYNVIC